MKLKISVATLFLFAACLAPRASFASPIPSTTADLTLQQHSSGIPYSFNINGVGTTLLSCLNDNLSVSPGESWTATVYNLEALTSVDSASTNVGGITVGELEEDAYLDSLYTSNTGSTTNEEVQDAIWSILDGTVGNTLLDHESYVYTSLSGGIFGSEDVAVQDDVAAAAAFASATAGTSSFYSQFTYYVPETWGSNDSEPQQFMSYRPGITPEPSSLILLGTGIIGLAGAMRLRMKAAKQA